MSAPESTPYEQFGGAPFFTALVADFYARVATDPVLSAMYPGADLGPAEERLRMFLEQYWSGPGTYSERRGPPRLRMRHAPFAIDEEAHDLWLQHMRSTLDERHLTPELDAMLWTYLVSAAAHVRNA